MKKKELLKLYSFLLALGIAFSSSACVPASVFATAPSSEEKSEKEKEEEEKERRKQEKQDAVDADKEKLDAAKLENSENQAALSDMAKQKANLETAKDELSEAVIVLDGQLADVQDQLDQLDLLIERKKMEINNLKTELADAQDTAVEQYESMKKRIKFMYEKGQTSYVNVVFRAGSLTDMLNKAEYVEKVSAYDRKMLEEYQKNAETIEFLKLQLETEEKDLEEAQEDADETSEEMADLIVQKENQIVAYEGEIGNKEQAIAEYEAMIAQQNATIAALENSIREAEAEIAAMDVSENDIGDGGERQVITYSGGGFVWPAPSYTRISDDYGYRIHPTLGVKQFHNGVDMAAPGGSPILAAADGQVVAAAYSSTMGNYIMINHGSGVITIYMHASALYVSKGSYVSAGQKIGAVGTTGRSTGNHLHFSVRVNGGYVSPWNYL